ncbi:MAG: apolipoprotein N-acyltransferase [candidate division Zixibacteria bacterium]
MNELRPFLIIASAIAAVFCFPPFHFGPFIFIVLVPLLLALEDLSPVGALKYGFLWGVIFYFGLMYYIAWVTIPGMIGAVLILTPIPATAGWFFVKILKRSPGAAVVFFPSYFITWNWLFTMSDFNYPWTDIGYALGYNTEMIQVAELGGVYLISLIILIVNMSLYSIASSKLSLSSRTKKNIVYFSVLLIAMLYIYGWKRIPKTDERMADNKLSVGLIQGNMTRDIKWKPGNIYLNFERYFELSKKAAAEKAEIIIWPETAIPEYILQKQRYRDLMKSFVDSLGVPVLTGTPFYKTVGQKEYIFFNSAAYFKPEENEYDVYHKIHLVPVSEKIPFSGRFKILKEIRLGQADWSPGEEQVLFDINGSKFATVICFESVFPDYCRQFALKGAQFLVVITNDMWFGKTSLLEQHAMMSVFRAVENRIPVVRSANTGISMAVDKWGRVKAKTDIFIPTYLVVDIVPEKSESVYGRIGDVIPWTASVLSVVSIAVALLGRRRYN